MTRFQVLQGFTVDGAQMLIDAGEIKTHSPGTILFREGDAATFILLVLAGKLEVFVERQGRALAFREPGPGMILGELGVLCNIPRSASVRALGEDVVLEWSAQAFRRLLYRNNQFSERIMSQSLRNLIESERSLIDSLGKETQ